MKRPKPFEPGPGQESVWDYPRPPRLERVHKRLQVLFGGRTIADTQRAWRVLETSHPPVYYLPAGDIEMAWLREVDGSSLCEWKGRASYYDIVVGDRIAPYAAWTYHRPAAAFSQIADHIAFYAWAMEACLVDGEKVLPQPGRFYGGWITADIVGPFKGEPGSSGW
jgi:uncharacterized protein (DUF427 family)